MSTNPERYNSPESIEMSDLLDRALREMGPPANHRAGSTASREPAVESQPPAAENGALPVENSLHDSAKDEPAAASQLPAAADHLPAVATPGLLAARRTPATSHTPASSHALANGHHAPSTRSRTPAVGHEVYAASAEIPPVLRRAYSEISSMLRTLRSSRDALEQATTDKLHQTTAKLEEVTSATEVAATGLLDGLDRALNMVDELDELDSSGDERAAGKRAMLRDELFQSINYLQFQDITTQQLNYASSVLLDIERRLAEIAGTFDPSSVEVPDLISVHPTFQAHPAGVAFDPEASLCGAERRQALVDEILMRMD